METERTVTRLLLVDDHRLFREGLTLLLGSSGAMRIVAEASSGPEAIRLAQSLKPDVVLLDLAMPDGNGIDTIPVLAKVAPVSRIIVLSSSRAPEIVREAFEQGSAGYVCKEDAFAEVVAAIGQVMDGKRYVSPTVADALCASLRDGGFDQARSADSLGVLTVRERAVLRLLCEEKFPKEIAARLSISRKTVDIHKRNIMKKLGVRTDAALILKAMRLGALPEGDAP